MSWRRAWLLALMAFAGCAGAPSGARQEDGEWVEAEGWSPRLPDAASALDRALTEAQKRAVERVAGVRVGALTVVKNAATVKHRVASRLTGFIARYEILERRVEDGFQKVRIRALVRPARALDEDAPVAPPASTAVHIEGPEALGAAFTQGGYTLAGYGQAQFIVKSKSWTWPVASNRIGRFSSIHARVEVVVTRRGSGAVVWSQAREASGLDVNAQAASMKALERACAAAGMAATHGLSEYLWSHL